jgi:NAD(P)-dependent dehydrogenase (short-subunit alcohol dehydrogenase family)
MNKIPRHALITGAGSGLGRALAVRLARDGWHVAVCDIDEAGSRETVSLVERAGGTAEAERLDVTSPGEWEGLRDRLRERWERIDLLVNNAGVSGAGEVGRFPLEDWRWILDVNLFGVIHGCHYFVDWLAENPEGGHVVNTASMAAVASAPTMGGYNVSKAAVVSLSETLYAELLQRGVGVTVLCPGFVATNLLDAGRWHRPALKARAEKHFETARITADDVAEATLRAIRRRQLYVVLPLRGRVFWRLKRLVPQWFMTQVARIVQKGTAARVGS